VSRVDAVVTAAEPTLRRRITDLLAEHHLPGAAVGVVRGDSLAWSSGFGFADLESARRPDAGTVYRVASISKTVTATAIVQLRDRGRLSLDDPLVAHIPEFSAVRVHHGRVEDVTLRRLLSHRSGLISEGPFSYWDTMEFPEMGGILAALPRTEVVLAPDAGAKYSNLGFALLGEVVARQSGQPFESYARQAIFEPLGMAASSFTPDEALLDRMATGYLPHPFEDWPQPAGHSPARGLAAAAGLYTTVSDLGRWIAFQLTAAPPAVGTAAAPTEDEAPPRPAAVLSPRSLDEMHAPQAIDAEWTEARCLGWAGRRRGDHVFIGHGGSIHGFITHILFHKVSRTGVIVLTNEGRHQVAATAALDLLDILLREHAAQPGAQANALPSATPPEYRRFLGRYQLWAGAVTHVECRDGKLRLAPAPPEKTGLHAPATLAPTADSLVFRVTQGRAAGELLTFTPGEDDAIGGFTLSGFTYSRLGMAEPRRPRPEGSQTESAPGGCDAESGIHPEGEAGEAGGVQAPPSGRVA
jgi:CubicO group peptidase (beta-lactamase class C family)